MLSHTNGGLSLKTSNVTEFFFWKNEAYYKKISCTNKEHKFPLFHYKKTTHKSRVKIEYCIPLQAKKIKEYGTMIEAHVEL